HGTGRGGPHGGAALWLRAGALRGGPLPDPGARRLVAAARVPLGPPRARPKPRAGCAPRRRSPRAAGPHGHLSHRLPPPLPRPCPSLLAAPLPPRAAPPRLDRAPRRRSGGGARAAALVAPLSPRAALPRAVSLGCLGGVALAAAASNFNAAV